MYKKLLLTLPILLISIVGFSQNINTTLDYNEKMSWWRDAKFGMFIHWGPYSMYGGVYNGFNQQRGGAEWIMNRCKIPVMEYRAKASTFNPVNWNADEVVKLAKDTGMKYIVFTTKHHDGFAMFQSKASNFNMVDYTPFKRDIIDEFVKACRKHDIKFGFYYSQSQDWCNAGGATARKLIHEGWPNPDSIRINEFTAANKGAWDCLQREKTFDEYFNSIALPQVKELLERYSDISVIWWDTPMSITDEQASKLQQELSKYPQIITNDRLKRPNFAGDFKTPEGLIPKAEDIVSVDWETCMNIGNSWGYKSWENRWKTPYELIKNLTSIAARGGNYLLNIGPTPLGDVPSEAKSRLIEMGKWMSVYGEAIYGTQRSLIYPAWGDCTRKDVGNKTVLYLCVSEWPKNGKLILDENYRVKKASLLNDNSALKVQRKNKQIIIQVPQKAPNEYVSVIKLELNEKLPINKLISNTAKYFEIVDEQNN